MTLETAVLIVVIVPFFTFAIIGYCASCAIEAIRKGE
jgi:hypothetical protein